MTGSTRSAAAETERPRGRTPKKNAPTPKRREAERRQRRPLRSKRDRKEAKRQARERRRREQEAYAKGDERYFRPQDKGPARAFARDYVDARRTVSEFFLWFSLVIIALMLLPPPEVQLGVAYVVWPAMMLTILVEGFWIAHRVKKQAAQHFPNEPLRGVGLYAAMRMLQIRKLRLPLPQVRPGDPVVPRSR